MTTYAFSRRKPERRPVRARRAASDASLASIRMMTPPASKRSTQEFLLILYLVLAVLIGLFLALVYGIISSGGS